MVASHYSRSRSEATSAAPLPFARSPPSTLLHSIQTTPPPSHFFSPTSLL